MQAFANNPDVAFGDVNLAEDQVRSTPAGGDHNPGAGGWPTVKYFNKETGYAGRPYKQKTGDAMCDELGNDVYMQAHIEEQGNTHLCRVSDGAGCGEKVGLGSALGLGSGLGLGIGRGLGPFNYNPNSNPNPAPNLAPGAQVHRGVEGQGRRGRRRAG